MSALNRLTSLPPLVWVWPSTQVTRVWDVRAVGSRGPSEPVLAGFAGPLRRNSLSV